MIMHQHPLALCFSLHPLSSSSEAEMGAPVAAEPKSLSPWVTACDAAESITCSLCSFLSKAGLWPMRCVALAVVSASRFVEFDKTSWHWGLQKCKSLLMSDSEQHRNLYLTFSYELTTVIHVKKIHLCQTIDYFHSTVKSRDYFISFLYALCLVARAKCVFNENCLLNHLQWVPSSFSTSVKAEKFNEPFFPWILGNNWYLCNPSKIVLLLYRYTGNTGSCFLFRSSFQFKM